MDLLVLLMPISVAAILVLVVMLYNRAHRLERNVADARAALDRIEQHLGIQRSTPLTSQAELRKLVHTEGMIAAIHYLRTKGGLSEEEATRLVKSL